MGGVGWGGVGWGVVTLFRSPVCVVCMPYLSVCMYKLICVLGFVYGPMAKVAYNKPSKSLSL